MRTLSVILLSFLLTSCNNDSQNIYWVNSFQVECEGVAPMQCLQIQKGEDLSSNPDNWQLFYSNIIGFEFEPGFYYKLLVDENELDPSKVPADASSIEYTLVEVLEKNADPRFDLNGIWKAKSISNEPIDQNVIDEGGRIPTIEFRLAEMKFAGNDGCNNIFGPVENLGTDTIEFGLIGSTLILCPEEFDQGYNQAFDRVEKYRLEGAELIFLDAEDNELIRYDRVE